MRNVDASLGGSGVANGSSNGVHVDRLSVLAGSLVERALACYDEKYGFSTASCQVYDTAWAAMVTKTVDGKKQWLFPESFHYLIREQAQDGSWGIESSSQTVGILDTAAALLALFRHAAEPLQVQDYSSNELASRILQASQSLGDQLSGWTDIEATNHIGVELIIPALLDYLQQEDPSLRFDFKSKDALARMSASKLSRFRPEMLYEKKPSSAVHSLEAFIGKIDFDKVSHHLFDGSMMASPSSTAAFLMHSKTWSDEAEGYLRHVIKAGVGHGDGGIAGTFPIHYFEFNWVIATLMQAGFDTSSFSKAAVKGIVDIVKKGFAQDRGVIGFAPRAIDVDDTAKGLLALKCLGEDNGVSPDVMIKIFEKENAFATFGGERDPSLSSNCHVLRSLLEWDGSREKYGSQIRKTATFVTDFWWNHDGRFKDKWHLSHLYPTMLMVESFVALLRNYESNPSSDFLSEELVLRISVALFQACFRTLLEQRADGSWEDSPEQTAYAILALAEARHLSYFKDFQAHLQSAIDNGAAYLETCGARVPGRYWTSKTSYSVKLVFEAYVLAALKVSKSAAHRQDLGNSLGLGETISEMSGLLPLLQRTELFRSTPEWQIRASLVESALITPLLRARRLDVYPRDELNMSKDNYLNIIPFTWVGCNNRNRTFAPTSFMFDMMFITMVCYQTDEFMECVAAPAFAHDPEGLHSLIDVVTNEAAHKINYGPGTNGALPKRSNDYPKVSEPLSRLATQILGHKSVRAAGLFDRQWMEQELKNLLHAHTTQVEDNIKFNQQQEEDKGQFYAATRTYFDWVRSTAADHVAAAVPFSWLCCWVSANLGDGANVFETPAERYFGAAASRHISTMCRMYNDMSSVARDSAEGNLNSIWFPEFSTASSGDLASKKATLLSFGEYEHSCLDQTMLSLERAVFGAARDKPDTSFDQRKLEVIRFFGDVVDLYNQLYVLRDLSSSRG